MTSFVGALIATYFLSRLFLHLMRGRIPAGMASVVLAHLLSFVLLAVFVGLLKSYYTPFAYDASVVFIVPQLIWLVIDFARGKARPYGTN